MVEAAAANGVPKVYVDDEAAAYTYKMSSDAESLYWEFQPDLEYEHEVSNGAFERPKGALGMWQGDDSGSAI